MESSTVLLLLEMRDILPPITAPPRKRAEPPPPPVAADPNPPPPPTQDPVPNPPTSMPTFPVYDDEDEENVYEFVSNTFGDSSERDEGEEEAIPEHLRKLLSTPPPQTTVREEEAEFSDQHQVSTQELQPQGHEVKEEEQILASSWTNPTKEVR